MTKWCPRKFNMDLYSRFLAFHQKECILKNQERILVAFSGGKDSVCLLLLLEKAKEELGISVGACHINHGIRGTAADEDEAFCRNFCEDRKIPFYSCKCDVPAFCREQKVGLEEGARMERYRLLDRVAEKEGYHKIATAHTQSDQAETVLFRLVRGTGLSGFSGISPARGNIIRPLLPFSKNEIYSFLEKEHISFTEDSSNDDIYYSRNRIRRKVMPQLEKINPRAEEALIRFASLAARQSALCNDLCREMEEKHHFCLKSGSAPLAALSPLAKKESRHPVLFAALSQMALSEKISISFERFEKLLALLNHPIEGKIIEISQGFVFFVKEKKLVFSKNEIPREGIQYRVNLKTGKNEIPLLGQCMKVGPKIQGKVSNINKKLLIIEIASDKIEGELFVRNFQSGDRILMYNMRKSVKKILCDLHIPPSQRKFIPMVCDEKEILWIPFVGLCDKARDPSSVEKITLSLSGEHLSGIQEMINQGAFYENNRKIPSQ